MALHCLPVLALPGARVAPGGVRAGRTRDLGALPTCGAGTRAPLTSAGGMPSGGRQGSTMPCSRDTSLASGSCSKFLRKSGRRARVCSSLSASCRLSLAGPVPWSRRGRGAWQEKVPSD